MADHALYKNRVKAPSRNIKMIPRKRPVWIWIAAIVAVTFGLMSIRSGSNLLILDGKVISVGGDYVSFLIWFNTLAGFFYVAIGIGIWQERPWVPSATISLAILTLLVFGIFVIYIFEASNYFLL